MSKILVTGAAGFIGSQLAHRLWQIGHQVVTMDNFSYGKEDNLIFDDHCFTEEILREDICDVPFMEELFRREQFDYVYNIAAITPLPDCQLDPERAARNNIAGHVNVLELSRKYGVKNVVFASTSAVYENCTEFPTKEEDVVQPTLIYSTGKYVAEQFSKSYVDAYNMNVTVLRFANVYGPHLDCLRVQPPVAGYIIRELFFDRPVQLHSDGTQERDFVYVDDLLDLAVRVMDNTGFDVFNVSSCETHSINEMFHIIAKLMGKKNIEPEYLSTSHYWYRYPGLYEGAYPIKPEVMDHEVLKYTLLDNSHAREAYKWAPMTSFEHGLQCTIDFTIKVLEENIGVGKHLK